MFDGIYTNLEFIWMGTVLFPLPLPLFGTNFVHIVNGEITQWHNNGFPGALNLLAWCFDDPGGRGWMNQQGFWYYDWILNPDGEGLNIIVTFADVAPDCRNLQDPLDGDGLDLVHQLLAGIMFELPQARP